MKKEIIDGIYYENGEPKHEGIVEIDGNFYYAGEKGELVTGKKVVHSYMANGLVPHGTYTFDENGILLHDSYQKPERAQSSHQNPNPRRIVLDNTSKVILGAILIAFAFVLVIAAISILNKKDDSKNTVSTVSATPSSDTLSVSLPSFNSEVYLCDSNFKGMLKDKTNNKKLNGIGTDFYQPFVFSYSIENANRATLTVDGREYNMEIGTQKSVTIHNLLTNTKYDYTVNVDGKEYTGSFKTADTNRFINLKNAINTRDIGGYMTDSGKRIKQGVLIRGSEIDGLIESSFFLSDEIDTSVFNFKYDFDLRSSQISSIEYQSRLGANVRHDFYNIPSYSYLFQDRTNELLHKVFTDLANPDNYPMYIHDTYGTEKCGIVVFFIQCVLGVSRDDMEFEYSISGIGNSHEYPMKSLSPVIAGLDGQKGDTVNQKAIYYLKNHVGVTEAQIESIRRIYLEE